jgi:hypothetical protein
VRLFLRLGVLGFGLPRQRCFAELSSLRSDLDHTALHSDGHDVGAILRMKLRENFPHVRFDGFFESIELVGDDLVGVALGYQLQNFAFAIGPLLVDVMSR